MHPENRVAGTGEAISRSDCTCQTSGHLSCSDLGRAQNAGPTRSAPLWNTQKPESEQLRPGKYLQPRACFGQFPCRAAWNLSSVDWESTHAMSGGKPSVASKEQVRKPRYKPIHYNHLICDKGGKNIQWRKCNLFNKLCWENWRATHIRMKLEHSLTPYMKIN